WTEATSRLAPLGGQYVARIPATTSSADGAKINRGFNTTRNKGAGIRVYEYSNARTIHECRYQLEAIFWLCHDSESIAAKYGMSTRDVSERKCGILEICEELGLLNHTRLQTARIINRD